MFKEGSNKSDYMFNPAGFVCDENHANWNGIERVFGHIEFHYKQSIQSHKRRVPENAEMFSRLSTSSSTGLRDGTTEGHIFSKPLSPDTHQRPIWQKLTMPNYRVLVESIFHCWKRPGRMLF